MEILFFHWRFNIDFNMRPAGLEPAQVYTHYPLKIARLPFRHDRLTLVIIPYDFILGNTLSFNRILQKDNP